jgi:dCMP deaminase
MSNKELDYHINYMGMAFVRSSLSHAKRKRVGVIVVNNGQIISDGFNGTPSGYSNECEELVNGELVTKKNVIHAESNSFNKIMRSVYSSVGSIIYSTLSPCSSCVSTISESGVKAVVYWEEYRETSSLDELRKRGIELINLKSIVDEKTKLYFNNLQQIIPVRSL